MKRDLRRVCVFCGSSTGDDPAFREAATALGRLLVERRVGLVYGGGSIGLMGVTADAVLAGGGEVIGVIPEGLATREVAHFGLTKLHITPGMHARKAMMAELSDAFIAMPGGFGTYEELFEVMTWAQLGIHTKPIGVLDVAGYFRAFRNLVDDGVARGFVKSQYRDLIVIESSPAALLDRLSTHELPAVRRWMSADQA